MWYAIYETSSGVLKSLGESVADPLPSGLTAVMVSTDKAPKGAWNTTSLAFDPPIVVKAPIEPIDFLRRFTTAEESAIRTAAKTDVNIEIFMARLAIVRVVHLDNADTINGVNYLVYKALITSARGAEILA